MEKQNKKVKGNKYIEREDKAATKIYDNRSLEKDFRTLKPVLKEGMIVLDVGCGTGAISKDVAKIVGAMEKLLELIIPRNLLKVEKSLTRRLII